MLKLFRNVRTTIIQSDVCILISCNMYGVAVVVPCIMLVCEDFVRKSHVGNKMTGEVPEFKRPKDFSSN